LDLTRARTALRRARRALTRRVAGRYDQIGLGLVAAFAAWTLLSGLIRDSNPLPQVLLTAAAAAAYAIGRNRGRTRPMFVAGVVVAAILAGALASGPGAFAGGPLDPPLGYGNANGALYTLGLAAAAILAVCANRDIVRGPAGVLAVTMFAFAVLTTSKAASILALAILMVAVVAHRVGRWQAAAGALLVVATFGITLLVGLARESRLVEALEWALTERRATLWHEALVIAADHPIFGAGPGTFAETSPTALSDSDAQWAHSAYLQITSEIGIPGFLLLAAVLAWVFGSLYRSHQDQRLVVLGTATATAFAVHAGIDYVVHFPALVLIAALLTGLASSRNPTVRRT
jgi:O-antigen ligase